MMDLTTREGLEYLLQEARRQLHLGAYRTAMTWAWQARRLAGDNPAMFEQAEALLSAARRGS